MRKYDQEQSKGNTPEERELVERARLGDRAAFEQLISRFEENIYRMVYYRTGLNMDAEDLTQEIFIQAYKGLKQLKNPDLFLSWLYKISLNKIRDFHRKKRFVSIFKVLDHKDDIDQIDEHENSLDSMMKREFREHMVRFFSRLSRLEQEVFQLRFFDHLSITDISKILDKHESTIKTHLYRGIQKFKDETELHDFLKGEIH